MDRQHNLRSKSNLIHQIYQNPNEELIAQYIFNPQHHVNHVYNENRKMETFDTLLTGSQQEMWQRSLSNERVGWPKEIIIKLKELML